MITGEQWVMLGLIIVASLAVWIWHIMSFYNVMRQIDQSWNRGGLHTLRDKIPLSNEPPTSGIIQALSAIMGNQFRRATTALTLAIVGAIYTLRDHSGASKGTLILWSMIIACGTSSAIAFVLWYLARKKGHNMIPMIERELGVNRPDS